MDPLSQRGLEGEFALGGKPELKAVERAAKEGQRLGVIAPEAEALRLIAAGGGIDILQMMIEIIISAIIMIDIIIISFIWLWRRRLGHLFQPALTPPEPPRPPPRTVAVTGGGRGAGGKGGAASAAASAATSAVTSALGEEAELQPALLPPVKARTRAAAAPMLALPRVATRRRRRQRWSASSRSGGRRRR
ncbi:hypothetical protein T492DRAFT_834758 [Pavlovales sp. CCMP2436]|nr:hypothetical protein T492DRAFT_834758 [Pavlovales sp. CCMP2436]